MPDPRKYVVKPITAPKPEEPSEQLTWAQKAGRVTAPVVRVGGAIIGAPGGLLGVGANAFAEELAETLEGSKINPLRVAAEGAIGLVPGGAIVSRARPVLSFLKGAALSESANMARRATEEGGFDASKVLPKNAEEAWWDIGTSSLGGMLSGYFAGRPTPKPAPAPLTGQAAKAAEAEAKMAEFEKLPRKEKDRLLKERAKADNVEAEAAKTRQDATTKAAELRRAELEETFLARQEAETAAQKTAVEEAARKKFEQTKAGRVPSTTVSETTTAPDVNPAGGKGQVKTSFRVAKPKRGGDAGTPPVKAPQGPGPQDMSNVIEGEIIPPTPPARLALPPVSGDSLPSSASVSPAGPKLAPGATNTLPEIDAARDRAADRRVAEFKDRLGGKRSTDTPTSVLGVEPVAPVVDPAVQAAVEAAQTSLGGKVAKVAAGNPVQAWKDKLANILRMTGEEPPRTEPKTPVLTEAVKGTEPPVRVSEPVASVEPSGAPVASPVVEPTLPPEVIPDVPLTAPQAPPAGIPFRSSKTMATDLYRDLRAAQKAGELTPVPGVDREHQPIRLAGRAAVGRPGTERRVAEDLGDVIGGRRATDQPLVEPSAPPPPSPRTPPLVQGPPKGVAQTNAAREAAGSPEVRARAAESRKVGNFIRKGKDLPEGFEGMDPATQRQTVLDLLRKFAKGEEGSVSPEVATRLGLALTGAAGGAYLDDEDPLRGAVFGLGAGLAGPQLAEFLYKSRGNPKMLRQGVNNLLQQLPDFQRSNYLGVPENLVINSVAAPYGGMVLGSLEQALSGNPVGKKALKALADPRNFFKNYSVHEARKMFHAGEEVGRTGQEAHHIQNTDWSDPKQWLRGLLQIPAETIGAGDYAAQKVVKNADMPKGMAQLYGLTSQPRSATGNNINSLTALWEGADPLLLKMALPFKRTAINVMERGFERTPLVGFFADLAMKNPDTLRQQLVKQGMGFAVWVGAEQVGELTPPEHANRVRRFVTNSAGAYGLQAGTGFAAGQARARGQINQESLWREAMDMGVVSGRNMLNAAPLPTTQIGTDYLNTARDLTRGNPEGKSVTDLLPSGIVPGIVRDKTPGGMSNVLRKNLKKVKGTQEPDSVWDADYSLSETP